MTADNEIRALHERVRSQREAERANSKRAAFALEAVSAYPANDGEPLEIVMGDLLVDMRHLADQQQIPWDALLEHVAMHYNAERSKA